MRKRGSLTIDNCGWKQSIEKEKPLLVGNPCPWYTYSAIFFLEERITNKMSVFEYGCGNSTIWWNKHVKHVSSVDHNEKWVNIITNKVDSKVVCEEQGSSYVNYITTLNRKFDIIVVDGYGNQLIDGVMDYSGRIDCLKLAPSYLTRGGIIIHDNSDCEFYEEGQKYLISIGFKQLDFYGVGPQSRVFWGTSIFYHEDNILEI